MFRRTSSQCTCRVAHRYVVLLAQHQSFRQQHEHSFTDFACLQALMGAPKVPGLAEEGEPQSQMASPGAHWVVH